ncbi:MAG: hypothetical protein JRJ84_00460 [Deltaproteobacteria bacterium]|nr:hypothetical protein [Deltaproteobacteria bacterium]
MLLIPSALAANLVIEAKVPVEVWVSGQLMGELVRPSELHVQATPGETELTLLTQGTPKTFIVDVPEEGLARVVVGRTGITTGQDLPEPAVEPEGTQSQVEFRSTAREDVVLIIGDTRYTLAPQAILRVDLSHGAHPLSLRNGVGTVIWAQGSLQVDGDGLVVQVADGRMPEVAGGGGAFHPDQR